MARPRGAARSRRHTPPLDKPSRSGLLALRRFHDGLQTPALIRLLVRTEKEEISTGQKKLSTYSFTITKRPPGRRQSARATPASPRHPKKKSHLETRNFQMRFLFLAEHGNKRAASASPTRDTWHRPPRHPRLHQNSSWKPFDFSSAYFSALKLKRLASLRCEGLAVSPVSSSMPSRLILL